MQELPFDPARLGALVGVFVIGVTVLVLVFVAFVLRRVFGGLSRANAERDRLLREGLPAPATIVSLGMGGMTMQVGVHRHLQVQLLVQVQPPDRSPWQASLVTMISELQIPQLQPGAAIQVRFDPRDPSKLALEGIGGAVPAVGGASPGVPGMAPAPGAGRAPALYAPVATPRIPLIAKVGLVIGLLGALVGVAVAMLATGVVSFGLGSRTGEGDSMCDRAVRCCRVLAAEGQSQAACSNLGMVGVPDAVCSQALEGFEKAAAAADLTCE